jgi:membrane-associated phospholipid phosphatase
MSRHLSQSLSRRRFLAATALTATALLGATVLPASAAAASPAPAKPQPSNVVVEWNRTLLSLVQTPGAQPATIQPTRDFAIMSAAVLEAVNAVRGDHHGRTHRAQQTVAAAQAAHDVLTSMFPAARPALDQELATDLAGVASGRVSDAVRAGRHAATAELRARAHDGATVTPPPYLTTGAPGDYRPTSPAFAAPVFTHWGSVTPFVLRRGDQFRPRPPARLDSTRYAAAINEVQRLGQDTSTVRTPEQTTIAQFWAAPIQNYWNTIADDVTTARHSDVETSARTFAQLDLGIADATIALYDAKYAYRLWRPITAIRLADTDGNPLTKADPTWTPLATTPPDPSYAGAHSTISATAATILTAAYGNVPFTVSSPLLPGVTRSFGTFRAAAAEAGLSRIYAGIHTRLDHRAGLRLGTEVGRYTLANALGHDYR